MGRFTCALRLKKPSEFKAVFNHPKKVATQHLLLLYTDSEANQARLGLAVAKKKIVRATDRNKVKRVLRETFRICDLPPVDVVAMVRSGIEREMLDNLFKECLVLWSKLKNSYNLR